MAVNTKQGYMSVKAAIFVVSLMSCTLFCTLLTRDSDDDAE
jgi:hypothetical protein